jgi:hypothetical protein
MAGRPAKVRDGKIVTGETDSLTPVAVSRYIQITPFVWMPRSGATSDGIGGLLGLANAAKLVPRSALPKILARVRASLLDLRVARNKAGIR